MNNLMVVHLHYARSDLFENFHEICVLEIFSSIFSFLNVFLKVLAFYKLHFNKIKIHQRVFLVNLNYVRMLHLLNILK